MEEVNRIDGEAKPNQLKRRTELMAILNKTNWKAVARGVS